MWTQVCFLPCFILRPPPRSHLGTPWGCVPGCFCSMALGFPVPSLSADIPADLMFVLSPSPVSHSPTQGSPGGPGRPSSARGHLVTCVLPELTLFTTAHPPPKLGWTCSLVGLSSQVLLGNFALVTQSGRGLGVRLGGSRVLAGRWGGGVSVCRVEVPWG